MLRTSLYKYQSSDIKDTQRRGIVTPLDYKNRCSARFSSLVYYTESSEQLIELLGSYIRLENAVYVIITEEL